MEMIYQELSQAEATLPVVALQVDRRTLAKTRWRGVADDGREFGFELARPLAHRAPFYQGAARYVIAQRAEPILRLAVTNPTEGARLGWMIGNLHFPAQVGDGALFVEADLAIRQMLEREGIPFEETHGVFEPIKSTGHHH
jgi:urease accessory protein